MKATNAPSIELSAFNIMPGVAFFAPYVVPEGRQAPVFVATTKITRDVNDEVVHVVARPLVYGELDSLGKRIKAHSFSFDYNDIVRVVGSCVNPNDPEDSDCGWHDKISANRSYWPDHDTQRYDIVCEMAIDLLHRSGYTEGEDTDDVGVPVSDELQTTIMDALFRSNALFGFIEEFLELDLSISQGKARIVLASPSHKKIPTMRDGKQY